MKIVDANEAIKLLRGRCMAKYPSTFIMGLFAAADEIAKLPEVDAVPVVHGRWIETPSMATEYECSNCGRTYEWWEVSEAHYCPNCGAKMDGGNEDAKN